MKSIKKIICAIIVTSLSLAFVGCGNKGNEQGKFVYPDYELTKNDGTPSWEQGEKEDLTIDWYVDRSTFYWAGAAGSAVSEKIYEKTGIKINFITPLTDNGDMLNSILNSDKLPDLMTLDISNTTRVQMQEEGYAYPLDELAKRWAPTLFNNWSDEINKVFAATDGNLYCVPSLYYSMEDIAAFDDQGSILNAGGSIFAKKSYLDWYTNEYPEENPTTPSGFIKMCKAVKQHYNLTYTITTDAFSTSIDNKGIQRLAQYFAVPRESQDGDLLYLEAQDGYYDCLKFLNECYREGLITDTNFTNTKQQNGSILQAGKCFVFMGNPQDYGTQIREYTKSRLNSDKDEYVCIVFTNENGDAPVISNLAGNGDTVTMITKDCARPDRLIKFVDYLTSFEGQMLTYFGIEDEHWYYEVEPGETITEGGVEKTFKYGRVMWYDDTFKKIAAANTSSLGMLTFQLLRPNKAIAKLATFSGDEMYHYATYLVENMKKPLTPWLYTAKWLGVNNIRDASTGANYLEINTKATLCQQLWRENVARIITQTSEASCKSAYQATLLKAEQYGYKEVLEFDNKTFHKIKDMFDIDRVWAPLTEGYTAVPVTSIYGATEYVVPIPSFIERK